MNYDFPLSDKVALVTGGASGIGDAIAAALATKGARVAICDLRRDGAQATADRIGNGARGFACDVTDEASVDTCVSDVVEAFGRIDILVNSAGIVDLAPAEELSPAAWRRTLDVNLTGSYLVARAVARHMIAAGAGRIINMASQAGSVALDGHVAYCASKFGVIGMTKTMALEWGKHGIRANTISPTVVLTELGRKAWEGPKGDAMKAEIPAGRFAEPEEIAAAAVFLASEGADMINGADLVIDGGYTAK